MKAWLRRYQTAEEPDYEFEILISSSAFGEVSTSSGHGRVTLGFIG